MKAHKHRANSLNALGHRLAHKLGVQSKVHCVFGDQTAYEVEIQAKPLKCEIKTADKADKQM